MTGGAGAEHDRRDFFVSYTGADAAWAQWVAWELQAAGYTVYLQAWDFRPGNDFVHEMQNALARSARVMPVLSPTYLEESEFGEAEWRSAFAEDPSGVGRTLLPVRVMPCRPPGVLSTRVYIDLVGVDDPAQARQRLVDGVRGGTGRPTTAPRFPGARAAAGTPASAGPAFPGSPPAVSSVPFTSDPQLTGRDDDLAGAD